MDRNKPPGGPRGSKPKIGAPHHGSELYALGTKASTSRDDKTKVMSSVKGVSERKRDGAALLGNPAKKTKLGGSIGSVPRLSVSGEGSSSSGSTLEPWEQMATECESSDLVDCIFAAIDQQDSDSVVSFLCGAIKLLSSTRSKNDPVLTLSLLYLAKVRPSLFCNDVVTSALVSILRRDSQHAFKSRSNPTAHVMACNLLARGYHDKKHWPEIFLRAFIDDASNERVWSDNEYCAPFIENVCAAFGTRIPPKSLLQPELSALTHSGRDILVIDDDSTDNSVNADTVKLGDLKLDCVVQNRYVSSSHIVEKYVLDAIKEQLNRRQQQDCYTRNFLKFLSITSGFVEVRALSVSRLELWIHNGKLMKPAQELLTYICYNITGLTIKEHEVLATLVKMRLKAKPLINIYINCLKEMINLQPNILYITLKYVVQNELSNARNPNNMGMLATMFQTKPEQSAQHLAEIYQEFLMQREDCLRTLRVFLRELVKMLRFDINLLEFTKAFLTTRVELTPQIQQSEFRDRIFHSMVDIICLCKFLTVSPQVREANVSLRAGRDMKSNPILLNFYSQISQIELVAISWMFEIVPLVFAPQASEYSQSLSKILLLDNAEQYSKCDQWPPEPERVALMRMVSETPVHEDTLLRIILMGITKEIPITGTETIELVDHTLQRASALKSMDCPAIEASKFDIIDFLFSMAEYHHPENIKLPDNYEPPKLAIANIYWKAWIILLMISAHNPSTFGAFCWEHYPTIKMLMELCITDQFNDVKIAEEELQIMALERAQIIEFETHLAAQTSQTVITEETAILTSQLMLMAPMEMARRVPSVVLEQLQHLNSTLKLGHLLCRCRKPDLLLDIIHRHGTTQSMPWLSDLVQNSDGDFNHLPVQCLCEFLLSNSATINPENTRDAELLNYLRDLLKDENADKQTVCEVLEYLFRRLASTVKQSRLAALTGLKLILSVFNTNDEEDDWLLHNLPLLPSFMHARPLIILQLRSACQIENNPELVMIYIQFIAAHTQHDPVPDMLDHVMDMAQLIVERSTMFQHIIPIPTGSPLSRQVDESLDDCRLQTLNCLFVMFNNYIIKLREHKEPYEWADYPDLLMVLFDDGSRLPIHLNIIHAFVILLTHSTTNLPESIPILDYWFPPQRPVPQAFLPDTNEPIQLLPDWLKLKMIRSPVDRLVEAAMYDLTPDQIVLFVQNFGTPINSMSRLLALLDGAVIEQIDAVKNAILNKAYLAQLIEIQQVRGAKNGHITVQSLELHSHSQTVPDLPKTDIEVLQPIDLSRLPASLSLTEKITTVKASKEIEEVMELILKTPSLNKLNSYRFRKLIHQLVGREASVGASKKQLTASGKVISLLVNLVDSPQGIYFFQNIAQMTHACTFFRALLTFTPENATDHKSLMCLLDKIINGLSLQPQSKNVTLLQILSNKKKGYEQRNINTTKTYTNKDDFIQVLQKTNITNLEKEGRKYVNAMIQCKKTEDLVDGIIKMLKRSTIKDEESAQLKIVNKKGILCDWLAEVDSELITVDKDLQIGLMFDNPDEFRFYLLSLLCHQANWTTIYETVTYLLKEFRSNFEYSAVLNFIDALIQNPKLWQGRDKAVSKHEQTEVVLSLTVGQAKVFTEYVIHEIQRQTERNHCSNELQAANLNSRVNLLLKIIDADNKDKFNLKELIDFVLGYSAPESLKVKFLQQLYLLIPPMKFVAKNLNEVFEANVLHLNAANCDKVVNFLLTTLGSLQNKKDYENMSNDTEMLIRKLAATHPILFLRQLGVMSSLLQGKAHMNLTVLRGEYHLSRFVQIIRILELLQPLVFDDVYKSALQGAFESYFTFFRQHSRSKEAYHILIRFVHLLQAYINTNPSSALSFIEQYTGLLQELAAKTRHLLPLQQLVQGLSLLKHKKTETETELTDDEVKQDFDLTDEIKTEDIKPSTPTEVDEPTTSGGAAQLDADSRGAASFALGGPLSKQMQVSQHFLGLLQIVQHSNVEETIIQPLQEIESLTSKRGEFIDGLFNRLLELIFSSSGQVRNIAYILLIRHLKQDPGKSDTNNSAFIAYIQCLRDSNSDVASSAIDNLVEMTILLQEFATEILQVVFELGITSRLNTCTQIKKCIQTIKLQHGC